jgi:hypothetical protein
MATKLIATELDVYVDGIKVGVVTDCGDCWRALLLGRRRRSGYKLPDYDSRKDAVRGVIEATR